MTISPDDLVRREVFYCVSSLVSTLAMGAHAVTRNTDMGRSLSDLTEQAMELASPVPDYEEAAREAGWQMDDAGIFHASRDGNNTGDDAEYADNWQEACDISGIEPYDREVFEHWIVSDWLADKLAEKGEKVDKDFAGLTVWARTTTGQAISMDWVIEQIAADLNKPEPRP